MLLLTDDFYKTVLMKLIKKNIIHKNNRILISAGGQKDKNKFFELGFENVTITNVDSRMNKNSFLPYNWEFQDVEALTYKDDEFDFCLIHHGLHHCSSPHRGLLELYRIAKYGIIVFEGRDNFITRVGQKLGFSEKYELMAVKGGGYKYGGFKNSGIPNFVYRWTDNEVYKTIASYEPKSKPKINFFYGLELPFKRLRNNKNKIPYLIALLSFPFLYLSLILFHKSSGNRYAFLIIKPDFSKDLHPWLKSERENIVVNTDYINKLIE